MFRGYNNSPANDWRCAYETGALVIGRTTSAGIGAATDEAHPGIGEVAVYGFDPSLNGGLGGWAFADTTVPVFNLASGVGNNIVGNKLIMMARTQGQLVVIWELCPAP
jgi:hypothetical protein